MKEITVDMIRELENNQKFVAKMQLTESVEDVLSLMKEYGVETTEEELQKVLAFNTVTTEDGELSEAMLDDVSGGGWLWDWIKSWHKKLSKKNEKDINDILSGLF